MHQRQNGRMKLADAGFNAGFVDNILNGLEIILIVNLNHIPFESFGHLMFVLSGGFLPVGFADPAFFQGLVNLFIFFVISQPFQKFLSVCRADLVNAAVAAFVIPGGN